MKYKFLILPIIAGLLPFAASAEESPSAIAKKIFTEKQDSVVWVSGVAKIIFGAAGSDMPVNIPDQETEVQAIGTIIDTNGLIVLALSGIDPARMVDGKKVRGQHGENLTIEASSVLKEIKVIMPDGAEIPAEIVLKDADLDLAFLRVKTASKEARDVAFAAVDLKNSAVAAIMDEVVTVGRANEIMGRVPMVQIGQVNIITKPPRKFLFSGGITVGCPTFFLDGKLAGITANLIVKGQNPVPVVIPAATILAVAEQAKTAKPAPAPAETSKTKSSDAKPSDPK